MGADRLQPGIAYCYVLNEHSVTDLAILDQICKKLDIAAPTASMGILDHHYFFLRKRKTLFRNLQSVRGNPVQLEQLNASIQTSTDAASNNVYLLPVSVFWSHAPDKERSLFRLMFSERWHVTSRLRRMLTLLVNRKYITVHLGTPIALHTLVLESLESDLNPERLMRRETRILRVSFKQTRTAFLGPDRSHRRTLLNKLVDSQAVQQAIVNDEHKAPERLALKYANTIVSDISTVTVRFLHVTLSWFWNKIYDGIEINGLNRIAQVAETASVVYIPAHRSHIDYLLLGYLLYSHGLQLPHTASGDNLNMPIIGSILRRSGAFFMRRSFRDDALYGAVFKEYFSQLLIRGQAMKYFIEGGRTRTGRLLPAKGGLLGMTIDTLKDNTDKTIMLVPVYIGYEKLIEANSYLKELRGEKKTGESLGDIFQSIRLIKQSFGKVYVNFGEPLNLSEYLSSQPSDNSKFTTSKLGQELLTRINSVSAINPVNLVAMVTLCTPKLAIDEFILVQQIDIYAKLLHQYNAWHGDFAYTLPRMNGQECVAHVESLGMLQREKIAVGDILHLDNYSGVLLTWYRNNTLHTLALPSLLACLTIGNRTLSRERLLDMLNTVYPYLVQELYLPELDTSAVDFWLEHLVKYDLLNYEQKSDAFSPPEHHTHTYYQLDLLSRLIMQTLERFYIVIGLLNQTGSGKLDQASLEDKCIKVAERISRLYGLNAPEFFDQQLFRAFVNALLSSDTIHENADGYLEFDDIIAFVCRRANRVIRKEFRYAVLRDRQ